MIFSHQQLNVSDERSSIASCECRRRKRRCRGLPRVQCAARNKAENVCPRDCSPLRELMVHHENFGDSGESQLIFYVVKQQCNTLQSAAGRAEQCTHEFGDPNEEQKKSFCCCRSDMVKPCLWVLLGPHMGTTHHLIKADNSLLWGLHFEGHQGLQHLSAEADWSSSRLLRTNIGAAILKL